jgi:hypothetical protein
MLVGHPLGEPVHGQGEAVFLEHGREQLGAQRTGFLDRLVEQLDGLGLELAAGGGGVGAAHVQPHAGGDEQLLQVIVQDAGQALALALLDLHHLASDLAQLVGALGGDLASLLALGGQRLVEPAQGLAAFPQRRDVGHRPDHAADLAAVIAHDETAVEDVRVAAVLAAEAILVLPLPDPLVQRLVQMADHALAVLGVDQVRPLIQRPVELPGVVAQRMVRAAPAQLARAHVPVPDHVAGRVADHDEALVAAGELLAQVDTLGDVVDGDHPAGSAFELRQSHQQLQMQGPPVALVGALESMHAARLFPSQALPGLGMFAQQLLERPRLQRLARHVQQDQRAFAAPDDAIAVGIDRQHRHRGFIQQRTMSGTAQQMLIKRTDIQKAHNLSPRCAPSRGPAPAAAPSRDDSIPGLQDHDERRCTSTRIGETPGFCWGFSLPGPGPRREHAGEWRVGSLDQAPSFLRSTLRKMSSGAACAVHNSNWAAAWRTNISVPGMVMQPSAAASRSRRVCTGL